MPLQKLREFLDSEKVKYVTIYHSPAFTAQEIAASAHVPGKELAKTVMVKLDGRMAMVVLPASYRIDMDMLRRATGASEVELAGEKEFKDVFPACEVGAMPPFGNLYGMDVYVSETLADDDEIAFNAGSHTELIRLAYADFARLVNPKVVSLATGDM
jgi:Ala-tRNA(Pro) deacylase